MRLFARDYNDFDPSRCYAEEAGGADAGGGDTSGGGTGAAPAADATPAADAPLDSGDAGGTGEAAPKEGDDLPAWNGELTSMGEQAWFSGLDETAQAALKAGYNDKLSNYDKGYQAKFRTLADDRKTFETEQQSTLERIRQERTDLEALLYGEGDPAATAKEQYERDIAALRTENEGLKAAQQARQTQAYEQQADQIATFIEKNAEDIYNDDEAFGMTVDLLASGIDPTKALKMVRVTMTEAEEVPKSVAAMSRDSSAGSSRESFTLDWREAVKEEARRLQSK